MATDGHQKNIPVFYGRPGIYVKGSVVPALAGVSITLVSEKNSQAGGLKAGEVAISTVTGSDGKYVAGPLYDDTTYASQAALVSSGSIGQVECFVVWARNDSEYHSPLLSKVHRYDSMYW